MTTTPNPNEKIIRIAIPAADGRLHGHFGGCREFALIDAEAENRTIFSLRTLAAPPHQPGLLPKWLQQEGVQAVIVGGIGPRALQIFAQQGISVHAGRVGGWVEDLAFEYLEGRLTTSPDACAHHGHTHDHDHGPHHNGHDH